jgi:hypothetical protein
MVFGSRSDARYIQGHTVKCSLRGHIEGLAVIASPSEIVRMLRDDDGAEMLPQR